MRNILLSLFVFLLSVTSTVHAQNVKPTDVRRYIPVNAKIYLPIVRQEVYRLAPTTSFPEYYPGLIEHESCLSLTHSKCFQPNSQLLTEKEQGVGLGQITRKFNKDGSVKADYLTDLRSRHMSELKELSWENVKQRPDLQIRAVLVMVNDNLKILWQVKIEEERYRMADAAYNGGIGHTTKERLQCGLTKGCDPQYWLGNVAEIKTVKSQSILYGKRSAWQVNRHHVVDIWERKDKYKPYVLPLTDVEKQVK